MIPYLELFAFLDLIQDASNGIRPLRYPHEQAFLKTNCSVLALLILTNQERILNSLEDICFSKDTRRKKKFRWLSKFYYETLENTTYL